MLVSELAVREGLHELLEGDLAVLVRVSNLDASPTLFPYFIRCQKAVTVLVFLLEAFLGVGAPVAVGLIAGVLT